jgi:hypothetical protein
MDSESGEQLIDSLAAEGKKARVGQDGRILTPEEVVSPAAYRPESASRGLHVILEPSEPWRDGKRVPFDGPLRGASALLLWFRLNDRPIEGTFLWDRSGEIIAPALAIALRGLAADQHLLVTGDSRGENKGSALLDPSPDDLTEFLRRYFDWWDFRAYFGSNPKAPRSSLGARDVASFAMQRSRDLARWLIVADMVYDAGALEIWSAALDNEQLTDRLDLDAMNGVLHSIDLTAYRK